MKEATRYTLAVLGYIGLALLTKRFLTWTWGPIYFMTVLEVLPRTVFMVRRWATRRVPATGSVPES